MSLTPLTEVGQTPAGVYTNLQSGGLKRGFSGILPFMDTFLAVP